MSATTQEFKNENLSVSVERKPGSLISLNVSITPKATEAAYHRALKAINKEVSLPGFRKGKAPEKVIASQFGEKVKQEWRNTVLQNGFQEAINLINIQPLRRDGIRCTFQDEPSKEKGANFTIEFEAAPQVPTINVANFTLQTFPPANVTDKDIDGVIENVRYYFANWIDQDRPVQNDDFIDLDIEKLDEPKETICRDTRFHVKDGQMANWMRQLVIGLNVGESAEGTSEPDPGTDPEKFIPTRCKITVKTIKTPELPTVDDAFALKVGAPNVEQLRQRVATDLQRRAEQEISNSFRRQLDEWLLNNYQFEVPATLIQEEKNARIQEMVESMKQQQASAELISQRVKELEPRFEKEGEYNYRLFFLLMAYARQHHIEVSNDEVSSELSQQVLQGPNSAYLGKTSGEIRSRITQVLLLRKTRDHIINHAKRVLATQS